MGGGGGGGEIIWGYHFPTAEHTTAITGWRLQTDDEDEDDDCG